MRSIMQTIAVFTLVGAAFAQDPWQGEGSDSFYWHNRLHGCLAMASYGDYGGTCPQIYTESALQAV
jgi:hypothetical protein